MKKQKLTPFLEKIHLALLDIANEFNQYTVETHSLTSHWAYALANNQPILHFGKNNLEDKLILRLKKSGVFKSRNELKTNLLKEVPFKPSSELNFKFIDLFSGIGGFRLALQELNGFCALSSEWDKAAQMTYFNNYGELPFGDIKQFSSALISDSLLESYIPSHDILAAGFPCQPFSHAGVSARNAIGNKHGFECDTQGTLFFDIMRIVSVKRPKVIFLENVRNIETHDDKKTFSIIKDKINSLGYTFNSKVIDSSSVVPQRRLRCYMVCFRNDLNVNYSFPDFPSSSIPLESILQKNSDITLRYTISDRLWEGHKRRTLRNLERGTGFTAFLADLRKPSNTLVARYGKDGKECLIPQSNSNPRMLTPRECARLQGYPENFKIPSAKTVAYRQFGNSVTVPVVTKIAKSILKHIH
ncbi:DNA (cytosine-5)-methyltransferase 1 [Idiomarina loihiensis]|uniref:DNA cytosine methyltransferase n=1 Tax=Idiomarina TaxID=135575 RepID=UPI000D712893|nr:MULTISPECIES: DNA (cytosine-5-)-methyltransferase [Idiomarina]PWW38565.1 DNA (cytosine-5)-methyltransferase 1 [Idiomarina loihiensis]TDP48361.1 DNA (cytosine-5)-methyltransferase 1 [Idiomarina loihiensis]TDS23527.1 DNA (cytosine-5)-methyltransferase 1 [Idiomarina sp. H2]